MKVTRKMLRPGLVLGSLLLLGLTACGGKNSDDDGDTGTPPPPAATVALTASPATIAQGGSTTLTWATTNAANCTASGAWTGSRGTSGTEAATPTTTGNVAYTLSCTGPGGSGSATTTVTVNAAPTVTLAANPTTVIVGSPTTLTWSSTNATACTASDAWTGTRAVSGAEASTPAATGTASYTLTCTGAGGSANATAAVTVNPVPTASLTINGRAVDGGNTFTGQTNDGGIDNAAVTISVGSRSFAGTADSEGNFSIPVTIPESETGSFVSITALGSDGQPTVRFASLLGSFNALRAAAGADGVLTSTENFRVNVTNSSTAEFALVAALPRSQTAARPPAAGETGTGSSLPTTDAELQAALMAIDYSEALDVAVAIALVVDRDVALPAGISNTLELAENAAVRDAFIEQQRSVGVLFAATLEDLLADRAVTLGATAATVPGRRIVLSAALSLSNASPDEALLGNGALRQANAFTFNADGSGRFTTIDLDSSAMNWTVDAGGTIAVRFNPSLGYNYTFLGFTEDPNFPDGQVEISCRYDVTAIDILPLSAMTAQQRIQNRTVCDRRPEGDDPYSGTSDISTTQLFVTPAQLPALTADDVAGETFGLTLSVDTGTGSFNTQRADDYLDDLVSFNGNGTGTTRFQNLTFTWALEADGAIRVAYSNGRATRYRKIRDTFGENALLAQESESPTGTYFYSFPAYKVDGSLVFSRAAEAGVFYQYGIGDSSFTYFDRDTGAPLTAAETRFLKGFAYELFPSGRFAFQNDAVFHDESGTAQRFLSASPDSTSGAVGRSAWAVRADGTLALQRYRRTGCVFDSTDPTCTLEQDRQLFPLARSGNRQIWLERRNFFQTNSDGTPNNSSDSILRYYDQAPNGDYQLPRSDAPAPGLRSAAAKSRPVTAATRRPATARQQAAQAARLNRHTQN